MASTAGVFAPIQISFDLRQTTTASVPWTPARWSAVAWSTGPPAGSAPISLSPHVRAASVSSSRWRNSANRGVHVSYSSLRFVRGWRPRSAGCVPGCTYTQTIGGIFLAWMRLSSTTGVGQSPSM